MKQAYISEIYASVQGEGPFTGEPQIFIRLAGCPLRCHYCDTPASLTAKGHAARSSKDVLEAVLKLRRKKGIRTVSVTGGEPLAHVSFLEELLPKLKSKKFRVYLETAGIHPDALKRVVKNCDVVAMDMKLPSAVGRPWWKEHRQFLTIAGSKAFVKVVVDSKSGLQEIRKAAQTVKSTGKKPVFVLQPATTIAPRVQSPTVDHLSQAYVAVSSMIPRVVVMPQQHKVWRVR